MKTIWKYTLDIQGVQVITGVPRDYEVLHVGEQSGKLCLWVLADPEAGSTKVAVHIIGTGQPFDDKGLRYVGSVVMTARQAWVWHVFVDQVQNCRLQNGED